MDNIPPPPYSAFDYSSSGSRSGGQPHPTLTATTSNFDNATLPGQSFSGSDAASSTGEPAIYTPPYTPDGDGSYHIDSPADGCDTLPSQVSAVAMSASAYFESRPVLQSSTDILLVQYITVTNNTQPSDLPFPQPEEKWIERDVLPQDWETFVNYLIPSYADAINYGIADRKLKAELIDERMHRLTLDQNSRSRIDLRNVDAQLEPLRRSNTEGVVRPDAKSVIVAWNEGFFGPRGVFIEASEPQIEDGTRTMPGSWTNDPAEAGAKIQPQAPTCTSRQGFGGSWMRADKNGFRVGSGLVADSNGFRIGNLLVADGQGFKLGPIRADAHGFRIGGGNRQPHVHHGHHQGYHPERHSVHRPPGYRGRPSEPEAVSGMNQRDRSRSTSSSSSSGASSIESAGSLPDYDHLKDTQLLIAKQTVKGWLDRSELPITRQTVRQIREKIKAAKCDNRSLDEGERDTLRREVRDLFKEFRTVKRSQKKAWKAAKRERRSLRREAKRTRRSAQREIRQSEKAMKNAEKEVKKAARKEIKAGKVKETIPSMPTFPAMPEVLGVHTPPGAWPLGNDFQGIPHPPHYMSSLRLPHTMPSIEPPMDGRVWPFTETFQATNTARATLLQAEGRRIEAEAIREEALRKAEETRQRAQDLANTARIQAEEINQQAEGKAVMARERALATAARARERAEVKRQRVEANASIARQKAEANHMLADSNKMQAEVNRMRMQAIQLNDKARLQLLDVAEKLQEEADKLKREGERLVAEALQSAKDLADAFDREKSAV